MEKKNSELVQTVIFVIIFLGNLYLAMRYYSRDDTVGMLLFSVVVILAAVAAAGHMIEWR